MNTSEIRQGNCKMRRILPFLMALAIIGPGIAYGLGLGKLVTNSGLSEPFRARIDLVGIDPESASNLRVRLATNEQFRRAGIARPMELDKLSFTVVEEDGVPSHILVSSREPVVEPFLNFLLELNWPQGRLLREYTVLLDPPIYDPAPRPRAAPTPAPAVTPAPAATPAPAPAPRATPAPRAPAADYAGGSLGRQTQAGDTLWSIASEVRPDPSLSVQQTMLALLRANPEAFSEDNVNTLKRGYVLRIPDYDSINSLSQAEALATVREHHALWDQYRGGAADTVQARGEGPADTGADEPPAPAPITPAEAEDARLELISIDEEGDSGTVGTQPDPADLESMDLDGLRRELALAKEALAASDSENADLRGELQETSELIDSLERLIQLRETELAALQDQLGADIDDTDPVAEPAPDIDDAADDALADTSGLDEATVDEPAGDSALDASPAAGMPAEDTGAGIADEAVDEEIDVVDFGDELPAESGGGLLATARDLLRGILPAGLLDMLPGGIATLLGIVVLIIALPLVLIMRRRRQGADQPPLAAAAARSTAAATAAPDLDDDAEDTTAIAGSDDGFDLEDEDTTISAAIASADDDEEDITDVPVDAPATDVPAAPLVDEEPEEDPLAEINVYLAYERFDQAEELVREALTREPDNDSYRVRLLEVFYASGDKAAYEEAARDLYDSTGGQGEHWDTALAMWSAMSPERELFAEGAAVDSGASEDADDRFVDITAGDDEHAGDTVTIRPEARAELDAGPAEYTDDGALDLDLTSDGADDDDVLDLTASAGDELEETVSGDSDAMLDLTAAQGEVEDSDSMFDMTTERLQETAGGMDFNIASLTDDEQPAADADAGTDDDSDFLDLTAEAEQGEDYLDIGADDAKGDDFLDITSDGDDEDEVLDITSGSEGDDILDLTSTGSDDGDGLLDLTATRTEDPLDVTATGDLRAFGDDDLLNVTSPGLHGEAAAGEDGLLDLTAGSPAGEVEFDIAGGDDDDEDGLTFDLGGDASETPDLEQTEVMETPPAAAGGLDFDISDFGMDDDTPSVEEPPASPAGQGDELSIDLSENVEIQAEDDDILDLTAGGSDTLEADDDDILDLTAGGSEDETLEVGLPDSGLDLDVGTTDDMPAGVGDDLDLTLTDSDTADDDFLSLDLADTTGDAPPAQSDTAGAPAADANETDLSLDFAADSNGGDADLDLSFDLDDEVPASPAPAEGAGERLQNTVTGLTLGETRGDDARDDGRVLVADSEHMETVKLDRLDDYEIDENIDSEDTVQMPRDENVESQSDEDEADTKLNLAKAYIELGDNDGARTILEEVQVDGSDEQREEAGQLLAQLD